MAIEGLTPDQNEFLDKYIREHFFSGGKEKRAGKFAPVQVRAQEQFGRLPTTHPQYGAMKGRLQAIELEGKNLKFNHAKDLAKSLENDIGQILAGYDPTGDLNQLEQKVQALENTAGQADQLLKNFRTWRSNTDVPMLETTVLIPDDQIPNREGMEPELWIQAVERLVKSKADLVNETNLTFETELQKLEPAVVFARTANEKRQEIRSLAASLEHVCGEGTPLQRLMSLKNRTLQIIPDSLHDPMDEKQFVPAEDLDFSRDEFRRLFKRHRAPLEKQFEDLLNQTLEMSEWLGNLQPGNLGSVEEQVVKEQIRDQSALRDKVGKPKRNLQKMRTFETGNFLPQLANGKPTKGLSEESGEFANIKNEAQTKFREYIKSLKLDPKSDEMFDLLMKSPLELENQILIKRGLAKPGVSIPTVKDQDQKMYAMAQAKGMHAALLEFQQNKLEISGEYKTLTVEGEKYSGGEIIGEGGMGQILRFTSEQNPGRTIVVKSLLIPQNGEITPNYIKKRGGLVEELKTHRQIMNGGKGEFGRENVIELQGAVQTPEGGLYMVMETASGGDLEENRIGLSIASELGVVPEEVRTLLNQDRMKQAVQGLIYMRNQNVVHVDIKGVNFLVTEEGTIKVADFGSGAISDNEQGSVQHPNRGETDGYAPRNDGMDVPRGHEDYMKIDDKWDTFSLGKTAQLMQQNMGSPSSDVGRAIKIEGLTGAFERLTSSMTAPKKEDRISLEGVLESSYLKNLEQYSPEDVKKLSQLTIAYTKALKEESETVRKLIPEEELMGVANKEKASATDIFKAAKKIETANGPKIKNLQEEFRAEGTSNERRQEIRGEVLKLKQEINTWKQRVKMFGKSPKAQRISEEIKDLSEKLTRPSGNQEDPQEREQFLKSLDSCKNDPAHFANFVGLPSSGQFLTGMGIDAKTARSLAGEYRRLDTSSGNRQAGVQLNDLRLGVKKFLGTVQTNEMRVLFATGFAAILRDLQRQIDDANK